MSAFDERLDQALIPDRVANIRTRLNGFTEAQLEDAEGVVPGGIARLQGLLDQTLLVRASTAPDSLSQTQIDQLVNALAGVEGELNNYVSNGANGHLLSALIAGTDALVLALSGWPSDRPVVDGLDAAIAAIRQSLEDRFDAIQRGVTGAKVQLDAIELQSGQLELQIEASIQRRQGDIESGLASFNENAQALLASLQTQVAEQTARVDDLRLSLDEQRPRMDEAMAAMQQQFAQSQTQRSEDFAKRAADQTKNAEQLDEELKDMANEVIANLTFKLEEAQGIVGVITVTGTATAYGAEARSQKSVADKWSVAAVALGVLAGMFALLVIIFAPAHSTSEVVTRALGGVAILGVAGYAANQSGQHRSREKTARRQELILVAFTPFIEGLPDEKQVEARDRLVDSIFLAPEAVEIDKSALTNDNISLISRIVDIVMKAGTNK